MWIFLNDRFVPKDEARISVFDHGFLYGDGVYETLRAYDGRVFMLDGHLARLRRSAEGIGLDLPVAEKDWPALIRDALRRNDLRNAYIRITVSRGEGEIGLDPSLCPRPTVVVICKPLPTYPPAWFTDGVALRIVAVRRNLASALPPEIKSLNFLNNILAKHEASRHGAFDGIMLNADGLVTECTASNVFFVVKQRVCTPAVSCGILDGITRHVVLQLARERGLQAEEGCYPAATLRAADECFLTNTTLEVLPVREIDGAAVGAHTPGPVTAALRAQFQRDVSRFLTPLPA
jgi:branched-chain amino acid aminotransferase